MDKLLLVGIGGSLGAVLRYILGGLVHRITGGTQFPYGTLVVNLMGCLTIGFLAVLADLYRAFTPEFRIFTFTGMLGAFTTFSMFSYETVALLRGRETLAALVNVSLHVLLGLIAVWAGELLAHKM
ncbi:MAG: fluoride efflux transporter CrcB [Candidatus Caldatribacteriaceae bacterium]